MNGIYTQVSEFAGLVPQSLTFSWWKPHQGKLGCFPLRTLSRNAARLPIFGGKVLWQDGPDHGTNPTA